jgi:hypothetical protein
LFDQMQAECFKPSMRDRTAARAASETITNHLHHFEDDDDVEEFHPALSCAATFAALVFSNAPAVAQQRTSWSVFRN